MFFNSPQLFFAPRYGNIDQTMRSITLQSSVKRDCFEPSHETIIAAAVAEGPRIGSV